MELGGGDSRVGVSNENRVSMDVELSTSRDL